MLSGNIQGLKASQVKALERLGSRRCTPGYLITPEFARALTEVSRDIQRQVGLLLDRRGQVIAVVAGDAKQLHLPEIPRRGLNRLSGVRLVHTHLQNEALNEDDLTDLALLRLDVIAAIGVTEDGLPAKLYTAHLLPANAGDSPWEVDPPRTVHDLDDDFIEMVEALDEELARLQAPRKAGDDRDRTILIHVSKLPPSVAQESVDEMRELARSAGLVVVDSIIQRRPLDPKYVTGQGKLKSTIIKAMQLGAEVLVFDLDLTPSQVRALSEITDLKILDRTQVILDIFAQHAETREGRVQVELAQMRYLLPLLSIRQTALSRLTGGIGGRGPGETRLEVDRRRARDRITQLEREVKKLGERRELRRSVRTAREVPTIAVVGYTNAGKSTLLNNLTQSSVVAEDALFATLNPVSRRLRFPQEREVIITDTVGFIRNLPDDLMDAFRTTFEELQDADLLLHVIDASAHDIDAKHDAVVKLLTELELDQKPMLIVLNKMDRCDEETLAGVTERYHGIQVSAIDRETFGPLMEAIERELWLAPAGRR